MKIVIVGGGIAGLAAAIALAKTPHEILVLEQAPHLDERGAGLQIGPNGIKALDWLGVWERLRDHTRTPSFLHIMDGVSGARLQSIALAGSFDRRFGSPYVVTRRSDLLQALMAKARSLDNIDMRMSCPVSGLSWQGALPIIRTPAGEETAHAVIGADGAYSTLRKVLLKEADPPVGRHVLYRALVRRSQATATSEDIWLWLCPGGHVVHYSVARNSMLNFVAVTEAGGDWNDEADAGPAEVSAAFPGIATELRHLLGVPGHWRRWRSSDRPPAKPWGTGPATLIGDAAHPMAPYLAQGATAALEDTVALGQAFALNGEGPPAAAFRAMERTRVGRSTRLCRMSSRQGELYHASGAKAFVRNLVLKQLPAEVLVSRLSWIYGWRP
jgi:salicylate hydroxylase